MLEDVMTKTFVVRKLIMEQRASVSTCDTERIKFPQFKQNPITHIQYSLYSLSCKRETELSKVTFWPIMANKNKDVNMHIIFQPLFLFVYIDN